MVASCLYKRIERIYEIDSSQNSNWKSTVYRPEVKCVLGVNYVLKNRIIFGFEVLPGITYSYTKRVDKNEDVMEVESENHYISFGTSGEFALFSVAYRF